MGTFGNAAGKVKASGATNSMNALARAVANVKARSAGGLGMAQAAAALNQADIAAAKLAAQLAKVKASAAQTTTSMTALGRAANTAAGMLMGQLAFRAISAVIQQFTSGIDTARQLSAAIGELQTIGGGKIGSFSEVTEQILSLSTALGALPTDVAAGYYQTLSNQVVDASEAFDFLATAQKLATTTTSSTEAAVNALSSVMNSYGTAAGTAAEISDKLFTSVELGRLRLEEIGNIMGRVTPIAAELGVSIDEVMASFVTMTRQGVKANTAITQLRAVFLKLIKPGEELKELFKEWGVDSAEEAIAAFGGFEGVLVKIRDETKGSTQATGELFNRVRALAGILALGVEDGSRYSETLKEIEEASGKVNRALSAMSASSGRQLNIAWQEFKNTMVALGTSVLPTLTFMVDVTTTLASGWSSIQDAVLGTTTAIKDNKTALQELMEAERQHAKDKTWSDHEKEITKLSGTYAKTMATWQKTWDSMPDVVAVSTAKSVATFKSLSLGFTTAAATIKAALDNAFTSSAENAHTAYSRLLGSKQDQRDFEQSFKLAKTDPSKQSALKVKQLTSNIEEAKRVMRTSDFGTDRYNEALSDVKGYLSGLEREALNLIDTDERAANSVKRLAESTRRDLNSLDTSRAASSKKAGELLQTAYSQEMVEKIKSDVAKNETLIKDIMKSNQDMSKATEQGRQDLREKIVKSKEQLEKITPAEIDLLRVIDPTGVAAAAAEQLNAAIDKIDSQVLLNFDNASEELQNALLDTEYSVDVQVRAILGDAEVDALRERIEQGQGEGSRAITPQQQKENLRAADANEKMLNTRSAHLEKETDLMATGAKTLATGVKALENSRGLDWQVAAKDTWNKGQMYPSKEETKQLESADTVRNLVDSILKDFKSQSDRASRGETVTPQESTALGEKIARAVSSDLLSSSVKEAMSKAYGGSKGYSDAQAQANDMVMPGKESTNPLADYPAEAQRALQEVADMHGEHVNDMIERERGGWSEIVEETKAAAKEASEGARQELDKAFDPTASPQPQINPEVDTEGLQFLDKYLKESADDSEKINTNLSGLQVPATPAQMLAAAMFGASEKAIALKTDVDDVGTASITKPLEDFIAKTGEAAGGLSNLFADASQGVGSALASGLSSLIGGGEVATPDFGASAESISSLQTAVGTLKDTMWSAQLTAAGFTSNITTMSDTATSGFGIANESVRPLVKTFTDLSDALSSINQSIYQIPINVNETGVALNSLSGTLLTTSASLYAALGEGSGFDTVIDNVISLSEPLQATATSMLNLGAGAGALKTGTDLVATSIGTWPGAVLTIIPAIQSAISAMQSLKQAADAALASAAAASSAQSATGARYGHYFADGGSSRGLDTINAKLSKGEFVVNAGATRQFYSELVALNAGQKPAFREQGGQVTNVGDINVSVNGQETSRQTIREIASGLRRELKRGTIKL